MGQIGDECQHVDLLTPHRTGEQCSVKLRNLKCECPTIEKNQAATSGDPKTPEPLWAFSVKTVYSGGD
ncbi:hypothetical protein PoB_004598200 [Plakobranchus ocellatus]|uniref:Uncharacterized protein n=1 Tax=Plakobranchus ocellatus TaxID=259542 RepID=A0AAV4BJG0_9GAST|nr:hypothetical protein PoB_004598200 [Plakobranchus ocellatus]